MSTDQTGGDASTNFRLSDKVVPSHYALTLFPQPNSQTREYRGNESITLALLEPTAQIRINVCDITITQAKMWNGKDIHAGTVSVDEETEIATITFPQTLAAGDWHLDLDFTAMHQKHMRGFYISKWTDAQGGKHNIATTQHEATEARKSFPCFDEPAMKAVFEVTMIIEKDLVALSNARIVSETPFPGDRSLKIVKFAPTPKMSTYLTCFIVGEMESSEPAFVNGKEIRIWCVKGKKHLTSWALKSSVHALTFFEDYFGIPYFGGDKIDHVAIPDFEAGAMENPGCVTYRETALLCDEATAPHSQKEGIAVTNQHETAHFWFGDLVTMRWWNGLWLNESFATFMENLCLSTWKPEWNIWDDFGFTRAGAMSIDGLKSTHPIEMPVNHPDDADELFDAISYNKGGSVLDMIHQFIGFEVFRDGIRLYLNRHAYGNTDTHDLWDALEESCRNHGLTVPVREIMDAWVFTAGHPVVSVEHGDKPGTIKLTQKKFRYLGDEDSSTLWPIPLIVKVKAADGTVTKLRQVFRGAQTTIEVPADCQWVNVNAGGSGVFRTRYSKELSSKLLANVQELPVIERLTFVGDAWACVRAGLTSGIDYIHMADQFAGETDPNVFGSVVGGLGSLNRLLPVAKQRVIRNTLKKVVKPLFEKLTWEPTPGESVQTTQLRKMCIGILGNCNDKKVLAKAEEKFQSWLKDPLSVDSNILGTVVGMLGARGDEARYEQFKQLWKDGKTPFEKQLFLFSLRSFRKPALLRRTLALCFTNEVSLQESPSLFAGLISNKYSQVFAWEYFRKNWEQIKTVFPVNMVPGIARACGSLDKPNRAVQVRRFFAKHEVKAGTMAVAQMLEQLDISVRMRQTETPRLLAHVASLSK